MTTTTTTAKTYAAAIKAAERITIEELAALIAENANADIFPRAGAPRRYANRLSIRKNWVTFHYTTKTDRQDIDVVEVGAAMAKSQPVFDFWALGRLVTVAV